MRLGQIEQLLLAIHQPFAPDATGADRDERLDDLEAVAERVLPRIEKCQDAAPPVRGAHNEDVHRG